MNIDRYNYEAFLLDFLEGRLSEEEVNALLVFLQQHPEMEDAMYHFESITLNKDNILLKDKELLFKNLDEISAVDRINFEEFCIARTEKQLSRKGEQMLQEYLSGHPEKEMELLQYEKLRLKADTRIRFPHKAALKKYSLSPYRRIWLTASAVAAVLAIIFLLWPFADKVNKTQTQASLPLKATGGDPGATAGYSRPAETNSTIPRHRMASLPMQEAGSRKTHESALVTDSLRPLPESGLAELLPMHTRYIDLPAGSDALPDIAQAGIGLHPGNDTQPKGYMDLKEYALSSLGRKFNSNLSTENGDGKVNWWNLAEMGVKGINQLTGSNIHLDKRNDTSGNRVLALGIGKFELTAPLR